MTLDPKTCYEALKRRDPRFDGRFFAGISSTGIYCRPVCPARTPKPENCAFFPSAAAAEGAGFRPCLRCRPELAPGLAPCDEDGRLARLAARRMEADGLSDLTISGLADSLCVTDRHLRRVFVGKYGVSPVAWLQTQRLLTAKRLLTDSRLTVTEVAMDAGFGSVRRLNALFRSRYHLSPSDFRKTAETGRDLPEPLTLSLAYRPPFAWETLLNFFRERAVPGVEHVDVSRYRRTVAITQNDKTYRGWISLSNVPERNLLSLTLSSSLSPVVSQVLMRVRFLFDLSCSPEKVEERLGNMRVNGNSVFVPGIRLPGSFDALEVVVRAILGQQITVRAARTLAARLAASLGEPVQTPFEELTITFPTAERICSLAPRVEDHLGPLGIIGTRARSILAAAEAIEKGDIRPGPDGDPEREMKNLAALPGLGPWTVQYLAMRALGWPDAFPDTDFGVKKALGNPPPATIAALAREWSPWRSYAVLCLWNYLQRRNQK